MTQPFHPSNAEIYAAPRNWDVACAISQLKAGVALTKRQAELLKPAEKAA